MADIREQLLAAFEVEYREHVDAINAALEGVRAGKAVNVRESFRRAHSLKGAARAVDLPEIEEAAHAIETRFAEIMEGDGQLDGTTEAHVRPFLDAIERVAAAVYRRTPVMDSQNDAAAPAAGLMPTTEFLRIDSARVQQLHATMQDLSSQVDQLDVDAEGVRGLQVGAEVLVRMLERPEGRREDAARAARALAQGLFEAFRHHKDAARGTTLAASRLREEIERIALAPASTVFAGLETMLRDMAEEMGKRIDVRIEGLETQADRLLLQSLRDPVIHLLRNAVAHGIESPLDRHSVGKSERGEIGLSVMARAGRLEVVIHDDGRGPDLARIEDVAIERKLLPPREERQGRPSAERLLALVFEPGFSTSAKVDRVAGRGMGLSVVAEAARRAGGGAFMRRRLPYGAEIVISAPLSAARQPVLLAFDGGNAYGLPTRALETVVQVQADALERLDGRQVMKFGPAGNQVSVPVVPLTLLLGAAASTVGDNDLLNVAVLRLGDQRLGVQVDTFSDVRTMTVGALTHPDVDDLVQGAIQLEQDQVAVVINPEALLRRYARNEGGMRSVAPKQVARARSVQRTVLIVDDSITTRTLEKSILEANGFRVLLAVDGLDALERLRTTSMTIDLVVADVEMPRMDGFQLLVALKADSQLASIPVIMMTSRASPDDVRRGMELGAEAYLVKQTFDQRELLTTIGQLI